jgi:hypothetical protein
VLLIGGVLSVSAIVTATAVAARLHSRRVIACSLLKTSEVSAAAHYQVKTTTLPDGPAFVAGGVISTCEFVESHPANIDNGPRSVQLVVEQRDFSKKSSAWTASSATKQFAHIRSFEAPVSVVHGLGDAAVWAAANESLYVLSGDLVLVVSGQTGPRKAGQAVAASESVDIALMRKALART